MSTEPPPASDKPDAPPANDTSATPGAAGDRDRGADKAWGDSPLGEDDRAAKEAYQRGRRALNIDGPTYFVHGAQADSLFVGNQYFTYHFGRDHGISSGAVRPEVLAWVRARYVPVDDFELMRSRLSDRCLLVLHGMPGTGRMTTALRLLDERSGGNVTRLDVPDGVKSLGESSFETGRGYVVKVAGVKSSPLTETQLDALRAVLVNKGCACVIIVPSELLHDNLGGYAVACPPPDTDSLLRSHIAEEVREDDPDGVEELLANFADTPRLQAARGPAPRPVETVRMAKLLADLGRGEIDIDEVEKQTGLGVHRQVVEWFAELVGLESSDALNEALWLAAFRIALSVFNLSPYNTLVEVADKLYQHFTAAQSGPTSKRRTLFSDDHKRTLPAARAHIVDGHASFGPVRVPIGLAEFHDDRFPVVLLSYVWRERQTMRKAMEVWLMELSKDPRPMIWVRAAQVTGLFCALDFHLTYTHMIGRAASKGRQRRMFAAVALDQAALDDRVRDAVHDTLLRWRRRGTPAQKWTAAATLGYELGRRSIGRTMEELRVLGTPSEVQLALDEESGWELVTISAYSLANLLAFGEVEPILSQLETWTGSHRKSLRELALRTVVKLIELYGYDLDLLSNSVGRTDRSLPSHLERWPLMLALQDTDSRYTAAIARLLRWSLRGRRGDLVARWMLSRWIRVGDQDRNCLGALVRFLPHLVEQESDARRLRHVITALREDWCDPLGSETAVLLINAVDMAAVKEYTR